MPQHLPLMTGLVVLSVCGNIRGRRCHCLTLRGADFFLWEHGAGMSFGGTDLEGQMMLGSSVPLPHLARRWLPGRKPIRSSTLGGG
jgi:hypothetical protein